MHDVSRDTSSGGCFSPEKRSTRVCKRRSCSTARLQPDPYLYEPDGPGSCANMGASGLSRRGLDHQQVTFLTDGGADVRELPPYLNTQAEHLIDWFYITMRLTVLGQMTKSSATTSTPTRPGSPTTASATGAARRSPTPSWNPPSTRSAANGWSRKQMRWSARGAHLLLQIRTQVTNEDLHSTFRRWYPGPMPTIDEQPLAA